ncbi:MAG: hypothetical protein RL757_142 [Bacteroidota bacterium]
MIDSNLFIRPFDALEAVPYDLLLLADETVEAINQYLEDGELYVGEIENQISAVFVLKVMRDDCIEIKNIAVSKAHQRQGIGTILLKYITENAQKRRFKTLLVGTCDQCFKEIEFYKKSGFVDFDVRKNFFIDHYHAPIYENGVQIIDMILLKKDI